MDVCDDLPLWQAPDLAQPTVEPSWEEMLSAFLRPEDLGHVAREAESIGGVDGLAFPEFEINSGMEFGPSDELLWSGGVSDVPPDFCGSFLLESDGSLPGLSSENSSLADEENPGPDGRISDGEVPEARNSVGAALHSPVVSNNSSDDASAAPSSGPNSPLDVKVLSPDTGGDSSDVGASGSCDNFIHFTHFSDRHVEKSSDVVDEDVKRESRLKRNRESASQSRMRKKSYVTDLEAKCRAMESQLGMLHQTVAFFSSQNATLREELAVVKNSKGHGSKFGAMEPAVLPSDSLPSESPSRRTTFLMVQWELVVFLFHVSLLMLSLPALLPSRVASEESNQNKSLGVDSRQSLGTVRNGHCPPIHLERLRERNVVCRDFVRPFDRPFSSAETRGIEAISILV